MNDKISHQHMSYQHGCSPKASDLSKLWKRQDVLISVYICPSCCLPANMYLFLCLGV